MVRESKPGFKYWRIVPLCQVDPGNEWLKMALPNIHLNFVSFSVVSHYFNCTAFKQKDSFPY